MVSFDELRLGMQSFAHAEAPAWSGRQQVHLVRIDLERLRLQSQSDRQAREVMDRRDFAKWYGANPGGSLHDVYIGEIEGVYEK